MNKQDMKYGTNKSYFRGFKCYNIRKDSNKNCYPLSLSVLKFVIIWTYENITEILQLYDILVKGIAI